MFMCLALLTNVGLWYVLVVVYLVVCRLILFVKFILLVVGLLDCGIWYTFTAIDELIVVGDCFMDCWL